MGRNRCDPGQLAQEVGPVKKSLPSMDWRERPGLDRLLAALDADEDMARYVGGAVRDTLLGFPVADVDIATRPLPRRSAEHTSELQSLMRISYAVFCLKKKKHTPNLKHDTRT